MIGESFRAPESAASLPGRAGCGQRLISHVSASAIGRRSGGVLALLALVPGLAAAQGKPSLISLSEYQKQEWHVEDGLPQGNVRAITQAPNRSLIIGTSEGITSFDGNRFTPFPIHSPG